MMSGIFKLDQKCFECRGSVGDRRTDDNQLGAAEARRSATIHFEGNSQKWVVIQLVIAEINLLSLHPKIFFGFNTK